jgi:hypothetical protein
MIVGMVPSGRRLGAGRRHPALRSARTQRC